MVKIDDNVLMQLRDITSIYCDLQKLQVSGYEGVAEYMLVAQARHNLSKLIDKMSSDLALGIEQEGQSEVHSQ